jgi:hypothetical protein
LVRRCCCSSCCWLLAVCCCCARKMFPCGCMQHNRNAVTVCACVCGRLPVSNSLTNCPPRLTNVIRC